MSYPSEWFYSPEVEQFLKRASATARILIRDETLIAKHGPMSQEGFQQSAQAVQRHWPGCDQGGRDRLVVMALDGQYQFLCAKCTPSGDYLLGLAFSMDTPLKHMRRDVANLMHLVTTFHDSTGGADDRLEQSLQLTGQPTSQPDPPETAKTVLERW